MPRTRAAAVSSSQDRKKTARLPQGWRTSDEDEIQRRRQRAAVEPLAVEALEPDHPVFGTFRVSSETGSAYEVEIRSLYERESSCGCPDYEVNGLGTCKHIEAVLTRVRGSRKTRLSPRRIEVFLRRSGERPEVRAQMLERVGGSEPHALIARYFTTDGALRGDPLVRLPDLARALAAAPPRVRAGIRLSRHLLPWIEQERRKAARQTARERFLADVQAGRATLDVVQVPLYPYQQEGMLHLTFTERALLADEMGLGKTVQAIAACELLRRLRGIERVLVICPASLKGEWEEQIARFTRLPSRIIAGSRPQRLAQYGEGAFFYLSNYEQILSDGDAVQERLAPDVIVLDEAQRVKNWQSRTARAVKRLRSPYAFVLTGTPLENRIDEIYSILLLTEPDTKILIFSEWERMLELVREKLQEVGVGFAWHTGSVPLPRRRDEVRRFKEDPACRLFLSTDSGGVGLNLQAANVVINLDLPWNPARLEQRIARAWRKHQTRPVRVLSLVSEGTIEHRMIPLLANKQMLADGVLDGRGDLSEMPLPSGRKALVERLETLTGLTTSTPSEPPKAADPWEPLGDELRTALGDHLLRLETHTNRDGRAFLLLVAEGDAERPRIEEILRRRFDGEPPVLELLDPAAFETLERLVESGVLSFPAKGRRVLHAAAPKPESGLERTRRLAAARATFAQAERKLRMATLLAGGGFPIEALPALREAVETALQARAKLEGLDLPDAQPIPRDWLADHLPAALPLLDKLQADPGALLGATEEEARSWIAGAEGLAGEIGKQIRLEAC